MLMGPNGNHNFGYTSAGRICLGRGGRKGKSLPAFAEDATQDEADVGWPLTKAPHEIRKPLAPERHVNPNPMSLAGERRL